MPKTSKPLTISIVIPVYNEESGLAACLDSIAAQTVEPDEVIVVDNNSTDGSAEVAAGYPFVTVLHEKIQGTIAARDRGFDAASGDIIGRIDADCILRPNWTEELKRILSDRRIDAVAGILETDALLGRTNLRTTLWSRMYLALSNAYFGVQIMQGGNMALRRSAWQQIRLETQTDYQAIHEDQDISVLLASHGRRTVQSRRLIADLPSGNQSYHAWPKLKDYITRWIRLKDYHMQVGTYQRPKIALLPLKKLVVLGTIMSIPFFLFVVTSVLLDGYRRLVDADSTE